MLQRVLQTIWHLTLDEEVWMSLGFGPIRVHSTETAEEEG